MNQQPFSSELISTVSQQERIPREPVINSSNVHGREEVKRITSQRLTSPFASLPWDCESFMATKFSHADAQKMKRLPTPSMMNDYYAASPRRSFHICVLCVTQNVVI